MVRPRRPNRFPHVQRKLTKEHGRSRPVETRHELDMLTCTTGTYLPGEYWVLGFGIVPIYRSLVDDDSSRTLFDSPDTGPTEIDLVTLGYANSF